jgi:hypothetical protein
MSKWVAWQITVCWRVRGVQQQQRQQQHRRRGATGPPAASWPGRRWVCLTPPGPPPAGCGGTPQSAAGKPQSVLRRQGRAGAGGREAGDRPCDVGDGMARLLGTRPMQCGVARSIGAAAQQQLGAGCRVQGSGFDQGHAAAACSCGRPPPPALRMLPGTASLTISSGRAGLASHCCASPSPPPRESSCSTPCACRPCSSGRGPAHLRDGTSS